MATKQKGVLYIKRNGIQYYAADRPDIFRLDFPETTIQDMEVINKEELLQLLQSFITTNKLLPSRSIIVLSDAVFFQKDITITKPEDLETQTKLFLNNVPFEHVTFKVFDIEKSKRILATNKDLYQHIKDYLEKNGFTIALVVAPLSLGKEPLSENLTLEQAKVIIQKMDTIKPTENFLEQPKPLVNAESSQSYIPLQKKKTAKSTLPLLLPVFGLLIAVLVGVYYMQSRQNNSFKAQGAQVLSPFPTIAPIVSPTVEPTASTSTESAMLLRKETSIQILNGSQIPGQAEKTKKDLNIAGYDNIKTGNAQSVATSKTLMIIVKSVPEYVRSDIHTQLEKTYQEISTQETEDAEFDVIITLGNLIASTPSASP